MIMDAPPPIVIGLDGLIKHSLPRIAKFRSAAAAMTNFGRLSPFLKRLQVSVLLLGTIYRKISQYDTMPGSDLCMGICHDSLAQTQGMMEAVLRADDDNAYNVGRGVLVERLPEEIDSFITSVELLRSTYREYVPYGLFSSAANAGQSTIRVYTPIYERAYRAKARLLRAFETVHA